jgi:predicted N-acetyltransferase YhbS
MRPCVRAVHVRPGPRHMCRGHPSSPSPYCLWVRLVELERITYDDWQRVLAGEPKPWGGVGETLRWQEKSHNLGLRDDAGNLVALAGLLLTEVRVADVPLQVAGIGGVIVTHSARGRGFARMLIERLLQIAPQLGAERAMLFCTAANIGLYTKFGFQLIEEPVWAAQPGGSIEMPLRAMWKPLTPSASWPAGEIELLGEPF